MKTNYELRYAAHPEDAKQYDTKRIRRDFLIEKVFTPNEVNMVYSMYDRMIVGGAMPAGEVLVLEAIDPLKAPFFLTRREMGIFNVGGPGVVKAGDAVFELDFKEALYLGSGDREVTFESKDAKNPAKFYFNSTTAHRNYPDKKVDSLKTGWVSAVLFEPSVGNKIFHEMVDAEKNLKVWHNATLVKLEREKDVWIAQIQMKDNTIKKIHAKILIDGTELGDIAKMCGVKYDVGMESRHDTKEDIAPEEKNNIVQDITYVAILKDYGKDVTIPCPEGYNKDEFACACASHVCITPKEPDRVWSKDMMITYGKLPNNKYMINWPIEGNDYYVNLIEMTREEREEALKYAKHYTMCFVYFLQHELGFNTLGLADDEYPTADKLPFIPYHRESRRIHGLVRFDLNHACEPFRQSQPLYRTCIAVGNYPVDHHHTRYHGYEELPNLYFHPIPSYGLPLGTLIPKDVEGLIVAEKSISVSNIINGTTRLQPMVMQIGQAAGALAALAVKEGKNIREVSVREVQNAILDGKGYLLPYLDVELDHPMFKSLQRIGSTGILKGIGKSVDWSNQMWFRADTLLLANELKGLGDVYPFVNKQVFEGNNTISIQKATELIGEIAEKEGIEMKEGRVEEIWNEFELKDFDMNRDILRSEMAILIDQILDPFNNKKVDITGQYIQ